MDADQKALWRRANAVFAALLKAEPDDVSAWLEAQGLEPPELEMVHRLLEAHEQEEGPLDRSAAQWVGSGGGNGDVADEGADPLLGREISGWHLKSVLGRGGMATVYLARRQADGYEQQAALKLLRLGLLTAEGRERFTREKQILAELSHRNIARLLDAGTADDGTPYLVMEYAEGVRVDTYVRENHLSTRACVALLVPICETVAFAQQHMVVHRDLKPSNIVIDAEGNPKLLDFGIARLLVSEGADSTTTRAFTPGFAAPEQFSGAPVSAATDVYGLGACLLRLLAPAEESPGPVLGVPRWNEPSIHRDLDPDLRNILGKTLKEDPAERYRDARELADELKAWLAGKPVQATGDSFTYRVRKFVGRNRIGVAAAG
ncbi:MAG: serine/threonine-protein kinase, partial [Pseudomonadota bacterium]